MSQLVAVGRAAGVAVLLLGLATPAPARGATCYDTCYQTCLDSCGLPYSCNPYVCNPHECGIRPITATASGGVPASAVDGDRGTGWSSGGVPPAWIELDLGAAHWVGQVKLLVNQSPAGATTHVIYGGLAAAPTTALTTLSGSTTSGQWLQANFSSAVNVRYLRITTTASPSWVAWNEIEVYDGSACGNGVVEAGEQCDLGAANGTAGSCCSATCTFVTAGTVCRAAAGVCDVAETCSGASPTCPADAKVAAGTVCRAAAGSCDVAETCDGTAVTCPADALVAAGTQCRASAGACDPAETCSGTAAACPADAKLAAGTVCRASAGPCDVAETCDGTAVTCPADAKAAAGTVCRASAGPCDVAETCNGSAVTCPADTFVASGTVCRASAGPCDIAETCSGAAAACPADAMQPNTFVCRAAIGECDLVEKCDGTAVTCPADVTVASGTACTDDGNPCTTDKCDGAGTCAHAAGNAGAVCRAAAGTCDVAETCTGSSTTCPADVKVASGTVCRASAGPCDVAETCNGTAAACPTDALAASGTVCRASAGVCDIAETCTGSAAACPADAKQPNTYVCRAAAGECDLADTCDGTTTACPADAKKASGTACTDDGNPCTTDKCDGAGTCAHAAGNAGAVCRAAANDCDVAETCNGTATTCPADVKKASGSACTDDGNPCTTDLCNGSGTCLHAAGNAGAVCRAAAGTCDIAETCNGSSTACPADVKQPNTYVCRAAAGVCDVQEKCDGTNAACPADVKLPTSTVCRASTGVCDPAENCDGVNPGCPADAMLPNTALCRARTGECDKDEFCTGTTAACPADTLQPAGYVCRALRGPCDIAEVCNGTTNACPADVRRASGYLCRAQAGPCDVPESCDGVSDTCPADAKAPTSLVCRPSIGQCDVAENCDGTNAACPTDRFVASGTACNDSKYCTMNDKCDGAGQCVGTARDCTVVSGGKSVTVVAKGTSANGIFPHMRLWVDGVMRGEWDVTASLVPYTWNGAQPVQSSVWVEFTNDAACGTCGVGDTDRNLFIDYIKIGAHVIQGDAAGVTIKRATDVIAAAPYGGWNNWAGMHLFAVQGPGCNTWTCDEAKQQCRSVPDTAGDHNSCTTGDTCDATTGMWSSTDNVCGAPGGLAATPTAGGVKLTWTNPTTAGLQAIEIYRTDDATPIIAPGLFPDARIYSGTATQYIDLNAPTGKVTYVAFALYSGGWSEGRSAFVTRDDSDGDGMPDGWELQYGLDPYNPGDANLDPDGDGLTNLQEYLHGTNPRVADTDGDGINDGKEVVLGFDPTKADTDGDGMGDLFELGIGLDPNNGHDFAIGNWSISTSFNLGAYSFDSGMNSVDSAGKTTIRSGTTANDKALAITSYLQSSPIGSIGSPTALSYGGYLYTIEEYISPNYPPSCHVEGLDTSVTMPSPTTKSCTGGCPSGYTCVAGVCAVPLVVDPSNWDPNGDPVSVAWTFVQKPALSALTNANISNATTPTPSFIPDVYGDYMLQLAVQDNLGVAGPPCYVIIRALNDQLFYYQSPFASVSNRYKMVSQTTTTGGALPSDLASTAYRVGEASGDRSINGAAGGTTFKARLGFLATAFGNYDVTPNQVPVADAGTDQAVAFGATVQLNGTKSYDPDQRPAALTYIWDMYQWPPNSTLSTWTSASATPTFSPDRSGTYVARLRVFDGEMTSLPDPVVITVANMPPVANAGADRTVTMTGSSLVVSLDGRASYDPEGKPITYMWRLYKKPAASPASALSDPGAAQPTFTAYAPGYYWLELTVKDAILVSAPDYLVITVTNSTNNKLPIARVGADQSLVGVNSTGLDGSASEDPDWDKVHHPDPDATGVYRKGLGYLWTFTGKPTGSTACITCGTTCANSPQTPASDCPQPTLIFNGYNGTYGLTLQVVDAVGASSDPVALNVTVSNVPNVAPIAVAQPQDKGVNTADPLARTVQLDGTLSYDPLVSTEVLTYTWSFATKPDGTVWKPTGSTAAISNPAAVAPTVTVDKEGVYKLHLKVCDSTGKCSCAWNENRPADAYCNSQSVVTLTTMANVVRVCTGPADRCDVQMGANWPRVDDPDPVRRRAGAGGTMVLNTSYDGVYDKPVILTIGFSGFFAAIHGGSMEANFGPFGVIVDLLRQRGYDVWLLTYDPVCSGGSQPNTDADWGSGGQDFCAVAKCACPYPEQPVDNHMTLNAAVAAYAARYVYEYGNCYKRDGSNGNAADAANPANACFVRMFGVSMGGVIGRATLAWADDRTATTLPFAAGESAPYALDGMRIKPPRGTLGVQSDSDSWDLGVRVFLSGDGPQQGANIPVSLQMLVKAVEKKLGNNADSGQAFSGVGFKTSGVGNIIAWSFMQKNGLRNWFISQRDPTSKDPEAGSKMVNNLSMGLSGVIGIIAFMSKYVFGWGGVASVAGVVGVVVAVAQGFLEGMVAGTKWAIIGAIIHGVMAIAEGVAISAIISAIWGAAGPTGPIGWIIAAIISIIVVLIGNWLTSLLFSVKTDTLIDYPIEGSNSFFTPFSMATIIDSPAAKELLYDWVPEAPDGVFCPDLPTIPMGVPTDNRWPSPPGSYGKESVGRLCDRATCLKSHVVPATCQTSDDAGNTYDYDCSYTECEQWSPNYPTDSKTHDDLYAYLKTLNGGKGYPSRARNVAYAMGSGKPGIAPDNDAILELYAPFLIANQKYPVFPHDRMPGSGFGSDLQGPLTVFRLGATMWLHIHVNGGIFGQDDQLKLLFKDWAHFPLDSIIAGANWPFIPTQSAMDLRNTTTGQDGCGGGLPCCQILPNDVTPHPQNDGQQNCCACTTPFDATIRPDVSLLHVPDLAVDPCRRHTGDDPWLDAMREACVSTNQTTVMGGVQGQLCLLSNSDTTFYLMTNPYGYQCIPGANEVMTRELQRLITRTLVQLDVRPLDSCNIQRTLVCFNGAPTCDPSWQTAVWVGGTDSDADGCPGAHGCSVWCETDGNDTDYTQGRADSVSGNLPPVVQPLIAQQTYMLPTCRTADNRSYSCVVAYKDKNLTPLSVSVSATDPNNDPLTYAWEFLPDKRAGQADGDLGFTSPAGATTNVVVAVSDKPPQGTYAFRVLVSDNRGASKYSTISTVIVPGDTPPMVGVSNATPVREVCEYQVGNGTKDAWRCYVDLKLQGSAIDPDGTDSTSILMVKWADVTDRAAVGFPGVVVLDDPNLLQPGLMVYASEAHVATGSNPLQIRLTAVDIRGQQVHKIVPLTICSDSAATCP